MTAGWLAGRWTAPGPASTQDGPATRTSVQAAANDGDFRSDYRRARAELMGVLEARRSEISPEAMASIQHNIELIDRAIADIEAALAEYPDDPNLNRSLRLAYDRQLEVLHTATRWTLQS